MIFTEIYNREKSLYILLTIWFDDSAIDQIIIVWEKAVRCKYRILHYALFVFNRQCQRWFYNHYSFPHEIRLVPVHCKYYLRIAIQHTYVWAYWQSLNRKRKNEVSQGTFSLDYDYETFPFIYNEFDTSYQLQKRRKTTFFLTGKFSLKLYRTRNIKLFFSWLCRWFYIVETSTSNFLTLIFNIG